MSVNSTRPRRRRKRIDRPDKPYPEFPLQPHGSGHWSKRIRGQLCYFGKWAKRENGELITLPEGGNWKAALARFKAEIDDLRAGRIPHARANDSGGATLADLCNRVMTSKKRQLDAHELSPRTFREYGEACDLMIDHFGKQRLVDDVLPEDFESLRATMAKRWGPARRGKFIQLVRSVFKYGIDNGLIKQPILFGSAFKKPGKAVMRKHKAAGGKKLFSGVEIQLMLDALDGKELDIIRKSGKSSKLKLPANPQLKSLARRSA